MMFYLVQIGNLRREMRRGRGAQYVNAGAGHPVFGLSRRRVRLDPVEGDEVEALVNVGGGGSARSGVRNRVVLFRVRTGEDGNASVEELAEVDTGSRLCTSVDVSEASDRVATSVSGGCLVFNLDVKAREFTEAVTFETDVAIDETSSVCQNVVRFSPLGSDLVACGGDDGVVSIWTLANVEMSSQKKDEEAENEEDADEQKGVEVQRNVKKEEEENADDDESTTKGGSPLSPESVTSEEESNKKQDLLKAERKFKLQGHSKQVKDLDFTPDGNLLASVAGDSTCRIWNIEKGQLEQILPADRSAGMTFRACCFATNERLLTLQAKPERGGFSFVVEFKRDAETKEWGLRRSAKVLQGLVSKIHLDPPFISIGDSGGGLTLLGFETLTNVGYFKDIHNLPVTALSSAKDPTTSGRIVAVTGSLDKTLAFIPLEVKPALKSGRLFALAFLILFLFFFIRIFLLNEVGEENGEVKEL